MSFIMPPSAVTSTSSIIIRITTVHPFATSWPSSPKGGARTLLDLLSVSYGKITILLIGSLRSPPPYPGCAVLLHGKACHTILRSLRFLTNRVPLPPLFRGQNKTPRNTLFINGSTVSTGYCVPPRSGGKVVAPATKGGMHFLARRAVVWFFLWLKPGC